MRFFGRLAINPHSTGFDQRDGEAAGFDKSCVNQPAVESLMGHGRIGGEVHDEAISGSHAANGRVLRMDGRN